MQHLKYSEMRLGSGVDPGLGPAIIPVRVRRRPRARTSQSGVDPGLGPAVRVRRRPRARTSYYTSPNPNSIYFLTLTVSLTALTLTRI